VVLPTDHQTTEPVQPGKEPLDVPAFAVAAQGTTVLRGLAPHGIVRRDQFDVVFPLEPLVQPVAVIGAVADQPGRELVEEALAEDFLDELALVGRSTLDANGERKTVSIGDGHDFRAFAAPGGADREAPFFAPAKVASTKASSPCNWPRRSSSAASRRRTRSSLPSRTHCWKRRWQVWYGGYLAGSSRHCAPVPSTHRTPFNTARVSCQGRPRPSRRGFGFKIGSSSFHCASLTSQRPRMPCLCQLSSCGTRDSHHVSYL